jgi:hypothetical protein
MSSPILLNYATREPQMRPGIHLICARMATIASIACGIWAVLPRVERTHCTLNRAGAVRAQLPSIGLALDQLKSDCGRYPSARSVGPRRATSSNRFPR